VVYEHAKFTHTLSDKYHATAIKFQFFLSTLLSCQLEIKHWPNWQSRTLCLYHVYKNMYCTVRTL